jgi:hypothetical protein
MTGGVFLRQNQARIHRPFFVAAEKSDLLPPGDSISAADGVGSRSQGRFFFGLKLSSGVRHRGFFIRLTL